VRGRVQCPGLCIDAGLIRRRREHSRAPTQPNSSKKPRRGCYIGLRRLQPSLARHLRLQNPPHLGSGRLCNFECGQLFSCLSDGVKVPTGGVPIFEPAEKQSMCSSCRTFKFPLKLSVPVYRTAQAKLRRMLPGIRQLEGAVMGDQRTT